MALAIGVDVGGTKIAAGLVEPDGTVHSSLREPTPGEPQALQEAVACLVEKLSAQAGVVAVGVAVAGFVSTDGSTVVSSPNLALDDVPLGSWLGERTGLAVRVENDANAAAWGEHRFGAGRGRDLVCVTVGTGVGGGVVVNGQLVRGHWGFAAEVGHIPLVPDGLPCPCGSRGCWEQYGSGTALVRYAKERVAADPEDAGRALLGAVGNDVHSITGDHITAAAHAGDPLALACFEEVGEWTGRGLAVLSAVLDPGVFVLGGGVSEAGALLIDPSRRMLTALHPAGMGTVAEVCAAELGNEAGLAGAADLARG